MQNWMLLVAAALLAIPCAWIALRTREAAFDIEPLSRHWLEEQKRIRDEV
jgi:hypothetical protein